MSSLLVEQVVRMSLQVDVLVDDSPEQHFGIGNYAWEVRSVVNFLSTQDHVLREAKILERSKLICPEVGCGGNLCIF